MSERTHTVHVTGIKYRHRLRAEGNYVPCEALQVPARLWGPIMFHVRRMLRQGVPMHQIRQTIILAALAGVNDHFRQIEEIRR